MATRNTRNGNGNGNGNGSVDLVELVQSAELSGSAPVIPVATPADGIAVKETLFKVGWNYGVWLSKNGFAPSDTRHGQFLQLSREASKAQLDTMRQLASAGCSSTVKQSAKFNAKDNRFDTVPRASVIQPGCTDVSLVEAALRAAEKRMVKRLSDVRAAAAAQGVGPNA